MSVFQWEQDKARCGYGIHNADKKLLDLFKKINKKRKQPSFFWNKFLPKLSE